jgi:hypothetical protein
MREREAPARVEAALLSALRERRGDTQSAEGVAVNSAEIYARRDTAVARFAPRFRRALFATAVAASLLIIAALAWRALARKETTKPNGKIAQGKQVGNDSAPQASEQSSTRDEPTAHDATKDHPTKDQAIAGVVIRSRSGIRGYQFVSSLARPRAITSVEALPISFREDGGRVTPDDAAANSPAINTEASELASSADFVPLVAPDNSAPLDSGQMVRVDVPRAALAALGLPVNASRVGASVRADVLLAHDGTARAIRLLP